MPKLNSFFNKKITALTLSLFTLGGVFAPLVHSAEEIFFIYNPFIISLRVESLEEFAKTGNINRNLGFYLNLANVNEQQIASFREALTRKVNVDPVLLSRSLNTESVERLLSYFGSVINIKGGSNGKFLLRGALVQAAFEEEGLTLLGVLQKLAVDVQVDIPKIITYGRQVELVVRGSELFAQQIAVLGEEEAKLSEKIDFSQKADIRLLGSSKFTSSTINLNDEARDRRFYAQIFQPEELKGDNIPVVVFSHGLSSRPEDFEKRAIHLASYGYVVVMPQHPGSDILKTEDFLAGYTRSVFDTQEFIDRPKDISFVLDELTRLNDSQFQGKLNLESVGVAGHSFGGYTALAVAGATLDFENLETDCNSSIGYLNAALLLQCDALKLDRKPEESEEYNLRDSRIKAVFVSNPVNASIFGEKGLSNLNIPVFISAGSYDPATPFVFEQGRTFPFIGSEFTYLQLQEGQAHVDFSELDVGITDLINTVDILTLPTPYLLDTYTHSMTLAFFRTHLNNQSQYDVYLQSSYAQYISQGQEFKTYLITKESASKLDAEYRQFLQQNQRLIID